MNESRTYSRSEEYKWSHPSQTLDPIGASIRHQIGDPAHEGRGMVINSGKIERQDENLESVRGGPFGARRFDSIMLHLKAASLLV